MVDHNKVAVTFGVCNHTIKGEYVSGSSGRGRERKRDQGGKDVVLNGGRQFTRLDGNCHDAM